MNKICSELKAYSLPDCNTGNVQQTDFYFENGKMYNSGKLCGEIVYQEGNNLVVKMISENKYLNGQIQNIIIR